MRTRGRHDANQRVLFSVLGDDRPLQAVHFLHERSQTAHARLIARAQLVPHMARQLRGSSMQRLLQGMVTLLPNPWQTAARLNRCERTSCLASSLWNVQGNMCHDGRTWVRQTDDTDSAS